MINVISTRFGKLELADSAEIRFPRGIIGFSGETRFVILEREKGPIAYLQSLKTPGLALPVIDASLLAPTYPELARAELAAMAGIPEHDMAVLVVLAIDEVDRSLRANLLAPVAVCADSRIGSQIILDPNKYGASVAVGDSPMANRPFIAASMNSKPTVGQLQHG